MTSLSPVTHTGPLSESDERDSGVSEAGHDAGHGSVSSGFLRLLTERRSSKSRVPYWTRAQLLTSQTMDSLRGEGARSQMASRP
jgi:hypothetical protein